MKNKTLALITYYLRWLAWAVHYLIIWPAATLVLIVALLFCLDNTTPGAVAVNYLQKAGSIINGQHLTWRECTKQAPAEFSPSSVKSEHIGNIHQEACPEMVSDARGYASYIDRSLRDPVFGVWLLMGLTYAGLAWLLGIRPYFPRYVFVKVANDKGYIRCALSRPERGMGVSAVSPVKKEPEKYQGCDVYTSCLPSLVVNKNAKWPENESEK